MKPDSRIYVAGHTGLVGSALVRLLQAEGFTNLLTAPRRELDLCRQADTEAWLGKHRPEVVIVAAARVGGIRANSSLPADFIGENLSIALNVINGSLHAGVPRLLFLGSACIYPKHAPQPVSEEALLTSALEPTNEPYAIAKIAGLKLCEAFRRQHDVTYHSLMPANLYGPGDNYHPDHSHVIPGLLRRFHEAKERGDSEVVMWGTGTPRREFLHVDDLARACLLVLNQENPPDWLNVGTGYDLPVSELAELVADTVGYRGAIVQDDSKPDGTPRKLLNISRLQAAGWKPLVSLREGLRSTYETYLAAVEAGTARQ